MKHTIIIIASALLFSCNKKETPTPEYSIIGSEWKLSGHPKFTIQFDKDSVTVVNLRYAYRINGDTLTQVLEPPRPCIYKVTKDTLYLKNFTAPFELTKYYR
jgi:hypothetical protein